LDQHSSFRRDSRGGCTPHKKRRPKRALPSHAPIQKLLQFDKKLAQ